MAFLEPVIEAVNEVAGDVAGGATILKGSFPGPSQPGQVKPSDPTAVPSSPPFGLPRGPTATNPLYYKNWGKLWNDVVGGSTHHQSGPSQQVRFNNQTLQALGNITAALSSITDMLGDLELADEDLRNRVLPELQAELDTFAQEVGGGSNAYALALYDNAIAQLQAAQSSILAQTDHGFRVVEGEITDAKDAAETYAKSIHDSLLDATDHGFRVVQKEITDAKDAAETYAKSIHDSLLADTDHGFRVVEQQIGGLNENLGQLKTSTQAEIADGINTAEGFATGLVGGMATQILSQVGQQLAPIQTAVDDCLEPLCDTVTPNASQLGRLGRVLKELEGLVAGGLLAGLLAASVSDPGGTATAVVEVTGWIPELGVTLAQAVGAAVGE